MLEGDSVALFGLKWNSSVRKLLSGEEICFKKKFKKRNMTIGSSFAFFPFALALAVLGFFALQQYWVF